MVQQVIGVFYRIKDMLIGSKTKKVPKPRKLVIVTDIVPRLCIGEHLHHGRPVRHNLLRRHQLPTANSDSHIQNASAVQSSSIICSGSQIELIISMASTTP